MVKRIGDVMTREETKKLLAIIDATYPNFKVEDAKTTLDAWHFLLEEEDYNQLSLALKTYIKTSGSGFAPSVSQLIDMAYKPKELNELSETQAWDLVSKAVSRSGYNAEEEFNKLPPLVQKAVGSPTMLHSWSQSDMEAFETVVASNFQRSYRTVVQRERDIARLPKEARVQLESLQQMAIGVRDEE